MRIINKLVISMSNLNWDISFKDDKQENDKDDFDASAHKDMLFGCWWNYSKWAIMLCVLHGRGLHVLGSSMWSPLPY